MAEIELKYGCNPHQVPAGVRRPRRAGFEVLSGRPSYINILDALGAWQLVRELKAATGKPGAASFKHTSPAGAAVAGSLSDTYRASQFLANGDLSPVANAYVRARGGDRMCSFGDVAAVSDVVDLSLAQRAYDEVSDLIIAPGFEPDALELLKSKRQGGYLVLRIDPDYEPPEIETREVFGFRLHQKRNTAAITRELFESGVTAERRCRRTCSRPCWWRRSPSSTRSPTRCASPSTGRSSAWAPASSPGSIARGWPATRPTSGCCSSIPRRCACSSRTG